jgi:hypothetical protein
MLHRLLARALVAFVLLFTLTSKSTAQSSGTDCKTPVMHTEKWRPVSDVVGLNLMLPPGVPTNSETGGTYRARQYHDTHGLVILVGSGGGPRVVGVACELVIDGRQASITTRRAPNLIESIVEFERTPTDGPEFVYYFVAGYNAMHMIDVPSLRQMFWTITFTGSARASAPVAAPARPAVTPVAATSVISTSQSCLAKPDLHLPAAADVVDSALIQSLLASSPPIPEGHQVMQMRFAGDGSLAAISATESTLPDVAQRELMTLVATNVKPHEGSSPAAMRLRVDVENGGLRYTTLPAADCGS